MHYEIVKLCQLWVQLACFCWCETGCRLNGSINNILHWINPKEAAAKTKEWMKKKDPVHAWSRKRNRDLASWLKKKRREDFVATDCLVHSTTSTKYDKERRLEEDKGEHTVKIRMQDCEKQIYCVVEYACHAVWSQHSPSYGTLQLTYSRS